MARLLIPLPDRDFDTTEVAVPWRLTADAGHEVVFATEQGASAACDPLLLRGVLFGQLGADTEPKAFYRQMIETRAFRQALRWRDLRMEDFDALLLPGGHAPGMKQYLGCVELQSQVAAFARLGRPIAAICHGVLLMARAIDPGTGTSLLRHRSTTGLPKYMERLAHGLTAWKLGNYYRTYPDYVEDEVRSVLATSAQWQRGPLTLGRRGSRTDDRAAFVVEDGNYLSARWPGDAYLLARKLEQKMAAAASQVQAA